MRPCFASRFPLLLLVSGAVAVAASSCNANESGWRKRLVGSWSIDSMIVVRDGKRSSVIPGIIVFTFLENGTGKRSFKGMVEGGLVSDSTSLTNWTALGDTLSFTIPARGRRGPQEVKYVGMLDEQDAQHWQQGPVLMKLTRLGTKE